MTCYVVYISESLLAKTAKKNKFKKNNQNLRFLLQSLKPTYLTTIRWFVLNWLDFLPGQSPCHINVNGAFRTKGLMKLTQDSLLCFLPFARSQYRPSHNCAYTSMSVYAYPCLVACSLVCLILSSDRRLLFNYVKYKSIYTYIYIYLHVPNPVLVQSDPFQNQCLYCR